MNLKKMISPLLCLCLIVGLLGGLAVPARAANPTVTQTANVVIVVDFADTSHTGHGFGCLKTADGPASMVDSFNGSSVRSMKNYISAISYGQLQVTNIFPQYNETDKTIQIYKLPHNENYYVDQGMKNIGTAIIQDSLSYLQSLLSGHSDLDLEQDGFIDNLTLVIPSNSAGKSPIDSHQSHYDGTETVNGFGIRNYVVLSEYDLALGGAVASHEFLHTQGYPDLYVGGGTSSGCYPVAPWCIMSTASYNYPLAYLRSAISGWFTIPTVTASTVGYRLHTATATADSADPQAVILKTDLCPTEFFVVEYRKKGGQSGLDYHIPGDGLIVYRVNQLSSSNFAGPPYMVYLFRPGDSYADGHELGGGDPKSAFLSQESGRTGYGSADLSAALEDGALTYSDGRNSGIVISNVGSAAGDSITFDITYTELPDGSYWDPVSSSAISGTITDSYLDSDGTLYYLEGEYSNVYLSKFDGTNWTRLSTPLSAGNATMLFLQKYGSDFYVGYYSAGKANLAKWDGSSWTPLYSADANDMNMAADDSGVYLTYSSTDNSTVYVYRHTASGGGLLGSSVGTYNYAANLSITAEHGTVAVTYRDFPSDRVYTKVYGADQTWTDVSLSGCISSGGAIVKLHGGQLYLLTSGTQGNLLYRRDSSGAWTQLGGAYAPGSIIDQQLCFADDIPCVLYKSSTSQQTVTKLEATQLIDGIFVPMGQYLASDKGISSPRLHTYNGKLYAAYLSGDSSSSKQLNLKSYTPRAEHTHTYGGWTVATAATCTQPGSETRTCSLCGGTETRAIAAKGHSWNSAATVDIPAAYSHPGSQSIHCKNCDATKNASTIPAKPNPFTDVAPGEHSYYYTPVLWALDEHVTTGKTATIFAPFENCNRSQVVTFLWRAAGCPEPTTKTSPFTDVQDPNAFYYKAVLWAAEKGITNGMEPTLFAPNLTVTRGQFVTFLWRHAGKPAHGTENPFWDIVPGPHSFYYDAVLWASEQGVTNGMGEGAFSPNNYCLRGQTVTFLHRYYTH